MDTELIQSSDIGSEVPPDFEHAPVLMKDGRSISRRYCCVYKPDSQEDRHDYQRMGFAGVVWELNFERVEG
ncbi:hypothetical protein C6N40_00565 [Arenimonas caeni]|uniref:Uncharacterized protein n=1 Tax=Arenimonas caeni TaxID=2058085 RepID=A0A2P6MCE8_9GAMM|nr:hypothetical protein C6N40_00565 [Arenimonas caeni]